MQNIGWDFFVDGRWGATASVPLFFETVILSRGQGSVRAKGEEPPFAMGQHLAREQAKQSIASRAHRGTASSFGGPLPMTDLGVGASVPIFVEICYASFRP